MEELSRKKKRGAYYFYGQERFKIEDFISQLTKKYGSDGREVFYGDEVRVGVVVEACQSLSLFQSERCLLIRKADSIADKDWPLLELMLEKLPEDICIIFSGHKLDMRKKKSQRLVKNPHLALVRCDAIAIHEVGFWAKKLAQRQGKKIHFDAIATLQDLCGNSLYEIFHTVEKAGLFASHGMIEKEHVEAVTVRTRAEDVFVYSNAVASKNLKQALEALHYLYDQGQEPIALIGLLTRQYRWMLEIQSRQMENESDQEIAQAMGLYPKMARHLWIATRKRSPKVLRKDLSALYSADLALKQSGEPPHLVMNRLTLDLLRDL